jgi:hypothetical protein
VKQAVAELLGGAMTVGTGRSAQAAADLLRHLPAAEPAEACVWELAHRIYSLLAKGR